MNLQEAIKIIDGHVITSERLETAIKTLIQHAKQPSVNPDKYRETVGAMSSAFDEIADALKVSRSGEPDDLLNAIQDLNDSKNAAYSERNHLVATLARLFPAYITKTNIPNWDNEWHRCVYINLPSGQISYHYHDSEHHLFEYLPPFTGEWDGHDKDTVHKRLLSVTHAKQPFQITDEMVKVFFAALNYHAGFAHNVSEVHVKEALQAALNVQGGEL